MRRSKWKELESVITKSDSRREMKDDKSLNELENKDKDNNIIYSRSKIIEPFMINKEINISNGIKNKKIKITIDHVGHRLGEFNDSKKTPRYKNGK